MYFLTFLIQRNWFGAKANPVYRRVEDRASSQYLGFVKLLKILYLLDHMDISISYVYFGLCTRFVHHRNVVRRGSKVDGERETVEMLALNYIVNQVNYHHCSHLERKSQNGVYGNMWTSCYGE